MNALSQTGSHSATLIENSSNINVYLFSILNYKTQLTGSIIGSCYAGEHKAGEHIHTELTTYKIKEVPPWLVGWLVLGLTAL